jgi:hypothetical protein
LKPVREHNLKKSSIMAHLLRALKRRENIGYYGMLVFAATARFFLSEKKVVRLLSRQPGVGREDIRDIVLQIKERRLPPPSLERIFMWQELQDFSVCPDYTDIDACDLYRQLQFPEGVRDNVLCHWGQTADIIPLSVPGRLFPEHSLERDILQT